MLLNMMTPAKKVTQIVLPNQVAKASRCKYLGRAVVLSSDPRAAAAAAATITANRTGFLYYIANRVNVLREWLDFRRD